MQKLEDLHFEIEQPFHQLDMKFADTEAGNRDRFVTRNSGKCLFVPELNKWVIWNIIQYLFNKGALFIYD